MSKQIYRAGHERVCASRLSRHGEGDAYLLEANPNPQIAKDEDFAKSALHIGISYPELIDQLLRLGMRYVPSRIIG